MIRSLYQRSNATGIVTNAVAKMSLNSLGSFSSRALGIAVQNATTTTNSPMELIKIYPVNNVSLRLIHGSTFCLKSIDEVHVTIQSGGSHDNTTTGQSTQTSSSGDNSSSEGGACSQGMPNVEDEEDEQEEMFVTADPVLGHGNIQEWGGPRRGGSLAEPTRFGDWERKGRCTDF